MSEPNHVDRIPVRDDRGNTVWIRAKMGFGVRERVKAESMRIEIQPDGKYFVLPDLAKADLALLFHNILAWEGPDFDGKAITREALDDLDADFADQILAEINQRNRKAAPNPK